MICGYWGTSALLTAGGESGSATVDCRMGRSVGSLASQVGWLTGQGKNAVLESAMAKLFVSEMHSKAALDALQLHGGYGYMKESAAGRAFVDSRLMSIGAGSDETMLHYLAKQLAL